jgi:hypothetical protein
MSFCGQVLCQRMTIGPCALTMPGKPSAAALAVPAAVAVARRKNFRRDGASFLGAADMTVLTFIPAHRPRPVKHKTNTGRELILSSRSFYFMHTYP